MRIISWIIRLFALCFFILNIYTPAVFAIAGGKKASATVSDSEKEVLDNDSVVVVACGPIATSINGGTTYQRPKPSRGSNGSSTKQIPPKWGANEGYYPGRIRSVTTTSSLMSICSGMLACDKATVTAWHCNDGKYNSCDFKISKDRGPAVIPGRGLNPALNWTSVTNPRPITAKLDQIRDSKTGQYSDGFSVFTNSQKITHNNKFNLSDVINPSDDIERYRSGQAWGYGLEKYEPEGSAASHEGNKKVVETLLSKPYALSEQPKPLQTFQSQGGAICSGDSGGPLIGIDSSTDSKQIRFIGSHLSSLGCTQDNTGYAFSAEVYRDELLSEVRYICNNGIFIRLELDPAGMIPNGIELTAKLRRTGKLIIGNDKKRCTYPNPGREKCEDTFPLNQKEGEWIDLEAKSGDKSAALGEWSCRYDNWVSDTSANKANSSYPPPNGGLPALAKGTKATVFAGPYSGMQSKRGLICSYKIKFARANVKLRALIDNSKYALHDNYQLQLVAVPVAKKETFEPIQSMGRLNDCKYSFNGNSNFSRIPKEVKDVCSKDFNFEIKNGAPSGSWLRIGARLMSVDSNGNTKNIDSEIKNAHWRCFYNSGNYPPFGAAEEFSLKPEQSDKVISTDTAWFGPHPSQAIMNSITPYDLECSWWVTLKETKVINLNHLKFHLGQSSLADNNDEIVIITNMREFGGEVDLRLTRLEEADDTPKIKLKVSGFEGIFDKLNFKLPDDSSLDKASEEISLTIPKGSSSAEFSISAASDFIKQNEEVVLNIEMIEADEDYKLGPSRKVAIKFMRNSLYDLSQ